MNFTYSDEQTLLRQSLSQYLERSYSFNDRRAAGLHSKSSATVWRQMTDFGLLALPFAEDVGGLGGSMTDIVAIAELFGEHLVSEPYQSSVMLAGRVLARCADHTAARAWLAKIIDGTALGAFAHEEGRGTADATRLTTIATASAAGYLLSGAKRLVLGAGEADVFVVSTRLTGPGHVEGDVGLVLVTPNAPGSSRRTYCTVDGRRAADCTFDATPATLLKADAASDIGAVIEGSILALAAESVGAMSALLEMTVVHARSREQFGVPIGSFQALAHRLADMKIDYSMARSTLLYTTALVESESSRSRDVSLLKAQVGRLGRRVAESAVQIHGGVGTTDEAAVGHYLKRIVAIDAMFGDNDFHYRRVGERWS